MDGWQPLREQVGDRRASRGYHRGPLGAYVLTETTTVIVAITDHADEAKRWVETGKYVDCSLP